MHSVEITILFELIVLDLKTQALKQVLRSEKKMTKEMTSKKFASMLHRFDSI